jgi:hypothetical protein
MQNSNPYECPRTACAAVADQSVYPRQALALVLGMVAVGLAARQYPEAALSLPGIMAGGLVGVVSASVGRVLATEKVPRTLTLIAAGLFVLALSLGWIQHVGGERTLWAFACMCGGLLAGSTWPHAPGCHVAGDEDESSGTGEMFSERRN